MKSNDNLRFAQNMQQDESDQMVGSSMVLCISLCASASAFISFHLVCPIFITCCNCCRGWRGYIWLLRQRRGRWRWYGICNFWTWRIIFGIRFVPIGIGVRSVIVVNISATVTALIRHCRWIWCVARIQLKWKLKSGCHELDIQQQQENQRNFSSKTVQIHWRKGVKRELNRLVSTRRRPQRQQ